MKYKIVGGKNTNLDIFVERVNKSLKSGWSLYGPLVSDGGGIYCMQPMIKNEFKHFKQSKLFDNTIKTPKNNKNFKCG